MTETFLNWPYAKYPFPHHKRARVYPSPDKFAGWLPMISGGALGMVPELLFDSKGLIPALQQLLMGDKISDIQFC